MRFPGPDTISGSGAQSAETGTNWRSCTSSEPYRARLPSEHQQCLIMIQTLQVISQRETKNPGISVVPRTQSHWRLAVVLGCLMALAVTAHMTPKIPRTPAAISGSRHSTLCLRAENKCVSLGSSASTSLPRSPGPHTGGGGGAGGGGGGGGRGGVGRAGACRAGAAMQTMSAKMGQKTCKLQLKKYGSARSLFFWWLCECMLLKHSLQEQSFANLPEIGWPRLQLRAGQQLLQHCMPFVMQVFCYWRTMSFLRRSSSCAFRFNSDKLDAHVEYGLDWGQEMCAPLLVVGGSGVRRSAKIRETPGILFVVHFDCS